MLTAANKAIIRRLYEEVFNAGSVDVVADLIEVDAIGHDPTSPKPTQGQGSIRQVAVLFRTAFADLHLTVDDLIAEQDKVVARWTLQGTHQGTFMGVAGTGKEVTTAGIVIYRLAEEKITEYWGNFDALGLMRQLGAISEPGE